MHLYLIDANYLCYRAFHALGRGISPDVQVLFGFFRDIVVLSNHFNTDDLVFCFDSRYSVRQDHDPKYKENRKAKFEDGDPAERMRWKLFHNQVRALRREYLPAIGFRNVCVQKGYEADDLIAQHCKQLGEGDRATIVSADKDLYQLLNSDVDIWYPQKKKMFTLHDFKEEYGLHPIRWAEVKAVAGDPGDNVIGVPGVGEKTAALWVRGKLNPDTKKYEAIVANLGVVNHNTPLVKLPYPGVRKIELVADEVTAQSWNRQMNELKMESLVGAIPRRPAAKARKPKKKEKKR